MSLVKSIKIFKIFMRDIRNGVPDNLLSCLHNRCSHPNNASTLSAYKVLS